jgi:hypothetical protein
MQWTEKEIRAGTMPTNLEGGDLSHGNEGDLAASERRFLAGRRLGSRHLSNDVPHRTRNEGD